MLYTYTLTYQSVSLREGFNKKTLKVMEFSIQILPPPPPPFDGKQTFFSHILFYVYIMFIITKFGENFEEQIYICFF